MAIDLLKLDKDCLMPTLLRRKWKEIHGYDPVQEAQNVRWHLHLLIMSAALIWVGAVVVYIINERSEKVLLQFLSVLLIVSVPSSMIFLFVFFTRKMTSNDFARALERLAIGMPSAWPPETLYEQNWKGLQGLAEMSMKMRIRELLGAERQTKENTDWSLQEEFDGAVACQLRELKDTHAVLLAFQLVDEKLDRYFAAVQAEPATEKEKE